jgi:hypothetical protein
MIWGLNSTIVIRIRSWNSLHDFINPPPSNKNTHSILEIFFAERAKISVDSLYEARQASKAQEQHRKKIDQ